MVTNNREGKRREGRFNAAQKTKSEAKTGHLLFQLRQVFVVKMPSGNLGVNKHVDVLIHFYSRISKTQSLQWNQWKSIVTNDTFLTGAKI